MIRAEESLGGTVNDNDVVVSVYSDIITVGGDGVQGEVLAAIHLMQEGVTNFQAGLSQLKNAVENTSLATL